MAIANASAASMALIFADMVFSLNSLLAPYRGTPVHPRNQTFVLFWGAITAMFWPMTGQDQKPERPYSHAEGGSVPTATRTHDGGARSVEPAGPPAPPDATMATVVYVLYMVGLAAAIAAVVGVSIAHAKRRDAGGTWLESHYQFQIRTFWIGLGIFAAGLVTLPTGGLLLLFWFVWAAVRTVKGWILLSRRQPVPNPDALVW